MEPPIAPAALAAARESPWPYPSGCGHLGVQWRNSVAVNQQILDAACRRGDFTAAQALHRMTDGMINRDGSINGPSPEQRPTLVTKWARSVRNPIGVDGLNVATHVRLLRQHLADSITAAQPAAERTTVDLTSDNDDDDDGGGGPAPSAVAEAASLALATRLQAEADAALAAELEGSPPPAGSSGRKKRKGAPDRPPEEDGQTRAAASRG